MHDGGQPWLEIIGLAAPVVSVRTPLFGWGGGQRGGQGNVGVEEVHGNG